MKHSVIVIATLVSTFAFAQSLEEKTQRKEEDGLLQRGVTAINEACGTKIKGTWDFASFGGKLRDGSSHVGLNCATAADDIARMCNGDDTNEVKPAIQKGLTEFKCASSGGKDEFATMKGKTIVFATHAQNKKRFDIRTFVLKQL